LKEKSVGQEFRRLNVGWGKWVVPFWVTAWIVA